jgi:carboxyl-terminal processing protease
MRAGRIAAIALGLLVVFGAGIWLGGHPAKLPSFIRNRLIDSSAGLTVEATELIEGNYYRSVHQSELTNSSLDGMVRGLRRRFHDRFSEYFSPTALTGFNEEINGHFSGIGLSVRPLRRGLRAEKVFPDSPAARGGIKPGEVIVSVDGHSIAGRSSAAAISKIKGPEGTDVVIGVVDPPNPRVRELRLTRAKVELPVTSSRVISINGLKLGYISLAAFSEGAHEAIRHAVEKVERQGAEGIVLDLRGNPGGLLQEAVLSASDFLPKDQVVVTTSSRTQGHAVYKTIGGNLPRRPLVLLINRGTASSAEILTAALADDAGSTVVGTRSYGKGVFQQEIGLSNGGALKLTVGEYFTPNGTNLAGKGIRPDLYARDNPRTSQDEALQRALRVLAHQVRG